MTCKWKVYFSIIFLWPVLQDIMSVHVDNCVVDSADTENPGTSKNQGLFVSHEGWKEPFKSLFMLTQSCICIFVQSFNITLHGVMIKTTKWHRTTCLQYIASVVDKMKIESAMISLVENYCIIQDQQTKMMILLRKKTANLSLFSKSSNG